MVSDVKYPQDTNDVWLLAPYLKARELECPCCRKVILNNRFLHAFMNTRERLNVPIVFTSGTRCGKYQKHLYEQINANRRLKGLKPLRVPKAGFHRTGEAGDTVSIVVPGEAESTEEKEYLDALREDGWVGIGIQKERRDGDYIIQVGFTHLDVRLGAPALWRYGYGRTNG